MFLGLTHLDRRPIIFSISYPVSGTQYARWLP